MFYDADKGINYRVYINPVEGFIVNCQKNCLLDSLGMSRSRNMIWIKKNSILDGFAITFFSKNPLANNFRI
jgi:hypothetical protein